VDTDWARILALAPAELQPDLCDLYAISTGRRGLTLAQADQQQVEQRKKDLGEEPWRRCLSMLRLGEPDKHGLDGEALAEARRLSKELKDALAVPGPTVRGTPHAELALFLARHWPERHFVRRQSRDAWGNGQVECRTARGEELPEECLAAVFLQLEPVVARGLKVELRGRWALPTTLAVLRQADYGQPELSKIRLRHGAPGRAAHLGPMVSAKVAWSYAGRILAQEEEELTGQPLRQALAQLARQGSWMKGLWENWEEHVFYRALRTGLDGQEFFGDAQTLFLAFLTSLGVERSEDLELLDPRDLQPPTDEEDEALKKLYPRHYLYGGAAFDVSYRPERKRVLLSLRNGPRGAKVNVQHLPRWNGWAVDLDERGRVTPLR
jgi:hypothetical protein